jgi:hypothetical protein
VAEKSTRYRKIRQLQIRIRTKGAANNPGEDTQCLVYLEGLTKYFFVRLKGATDLTMEMALIGLLRDAFIHGKQVKLGYRERLGGKYISVAWVKH